MPKPEQNDQTCKDVQRFSNTAVNPQFQQPQPEIDASSSVTLPEPELFFQAVGLVRGQYLPSAGTPGQGILLLNDGLMTPTNLLASAAYSSLDRLSAPHARVSQTPLCHPRSQKSAPRGRCRGY
jgi:hypothetical protein